jgi:hypothetical protein
MDQVRIAMRGSSSAAAWGGGEKPAKKFGVRSRFSGCAFCNVLKFPTSFAFDLERRNGGDRKRYFP